MFRKYFRILFLFFFVMNNQKYFGRMTVKYGVIHSKVQNGKYFLNQKTKGEKGWGSKFGTTGISKFRNREY